MAIGLIAIVTGAGQAQAGEPNIGGGTLRGTVTYGGSQGLPPVNSPCRDVAFTFSAFAVIAIENLAQSDWIGTIGDAQAGTGISGSGSSACDSATVGGGIFNVNAIDVVHPRTSGRLICQGLTGGPLTGSYTRTLTDLTAVVGGKCSINAYETDNVAIVIRAELVPTGEVGDGVTAGITSAALAAVFTVVPAGDPTGS
jgi:hypothetical protein